jgi:hypothetical protein
MGKMRNTYKILVGKPEWKRLFGRPRRRWENIIQIYLREIAVGVWVEFIWLRIGTVAGYCEYSNETLGSIKSGEFLD